MFRRWFSKSKPSPETEFRDLIADWLEALPQVRSVSRTSDLTLQADLGSSEVHTINLQNAFRHHQASLEDGPEAAAEFLKTYLTTFDSIGTTPEISVDTLVPLVRHYGYLGEKSEEIVTELRRTGSLPEEFDGIWAAPFTGDLYLALANETPTSLNFVTCKDLRERDLEGLATFDTAFEAFWADGPAPHMEQINDAGLVMLSIPDADWATPSLLLMPGIFSDFMDQNSIDRLLVIHPTRAQIFFTFADLDHAEDMMVKMVLASQDAGHLQSQYVFSFDTDTGLTPVLFVPDEGAPVRVDGGLH